MDVLIFSLTEWFQKAIDNVRAGMVGRLQDTFSKVKDFDMKEELQQQANMIKENIQENVEWSRKEGVLVTLQEFWLTGMEKVKRTHSLVKG